QGGGGLHVVGEVQKRGETQVILITRQGERSDLIAALRAGAFDYLEEPFDFHDVAMAIGRAVTHRELRARRHADDERLRRLEGALRRMSGAADVKPLLELLVTELTPLLAVDRVSVWRFEEDRLSLAVSTHLDPKTERPIYIARQSGPLRDAVLRGEAVTVRPVPPAREWQVAVPMFMEATLVGVLLAERAERPFDEGEI